MPMKGGDSDEYREIDRWDRGVGWIAHPGETMQRASHALVGDDGGLWVIDPVDAPDVDGLLSEFGDVAGVVVCSRNSATWRASSWGWTDTNATRGRSRDGTTRPCTSRSG